MSLLQSALLSRIDNHSIQDSQNIPPNMLDLPLLCVATLTMANGNDNIFAALSYSTPDLAFTQYGSLMSFVNQLNQNGRFWNGLGAPVGETASKDDIINFNQSVFGPITQYQSTINHGSIGTLASTNNTMWYISPKTARYLLSISINPNGNNIYKIYYNSMYNVPYTTAKDQISRYCNIVNFSDPQCFCLNTNADSPSNTISIGGAENLSSLAKTDVQSYNTLIHNSQCLNSQCLYAASQNLSLYAQGTLKQCNPKSIVCGSTYITTENFDVIGQTSGKTIQEQCTSPSTSVVATTLETGNVGEKIAITASIVFIFSVILYFIFFR